MLARKGANDQRLPTYRGTIFTSVYLHPSRGWSTLEWTSVVADNIPALTVKDRVFIAITISWRGKCSSSARTRTARLRDLDLLSRSVSFDDRTRLDLLRVVLRERQRVDLMYVIARYALNKMTKNGRRYVQAPTDIAEMNTLNWCRANGLK